MQINPNIESMYCISCQTTYAVDDFFLGCPKCLAKGTPASLSFRYQSFRENGAKENLSLTQQLLPYQEWPSLGEGQTPHIKLSKLSEQLEIDVWVKNEGQNPTGSHKDRMSPFIMQRALETGAQVVAVASSGNAGVSVATYAAYTGLPCTVLTTNDMNPIWKQAIEQTGANIIFKDNAMERWSHMKEMVEAGEWYPATNYINPPVGSNPFGVQGYKAIAFEMVEQFDQLPEYIIIPIARGDLLWGIWEGFKEAFEARYISSLPKLLAVEPFPRLQKVFKGEPYVANFEGEAKQTPSVEGTTVTYQTLAAVRESQGDVLVVPSEQAVLEQKELASMGLYVERSSALVLGALKQALAQNIIQRGEKVLMLITSNGYKELVG